MKQSKLNKLINKGRLKAVVKDVAGRRIFIGYERTNKRSRKSKVKFFSKPLDLASLKSQPTPPDDSSGKEAAV